MRHRILLVALAFSALSGVTYAQSSPPVATTHETASAPKLKKGHLYEVSTPATVYELSARTCLFLDAPVILEPASAVDTAVIATATEVLAENCSKPQRIGLAIRRRVDSSVDVIHLLVAATSGHKLLHIDPGLC